MLRVVKGIAGTGSRDTRERMLEAFLCAVLIEVVAENYRYLMHEMAFSTRDMVVDPPLRANERVLSGLFATAISRVSPRSRPEVRVDRTVEDEDGLDDDGLTNGQEESEVSAGRVDYLAWYGDQTIAVELKVVQANIDNTAATQLMRKRWKTVNAQAASAQGFLRQSPQQYPKPSAIALLVIVGRRAVADMQHIEDRTATFAEEIMGLNRLISKDLDPAWQVNYTVPHEFRASRRKHKGRAIGGVAYTPIISFIASPHL